MPILVLFWAQNWSPQCQLALVAHLTQPNRVVVQLVLSSGPNDVPALPANLTYPATTGSSYARNSRRTRRVWARLRGPYGRSWVPMFWGTQGLGELLIRPRAFVRLVRATAKVPAGRLVRFLRVFGQGRCAPSPFVGQGPRCGRLVHLRVQF